MGRILLVAVIAGAIGGPASAHHSYSMFDSGRTDTLTGVVKSLDIVNPHSWLAIIVASPEGQVEYSLEMGGPGAVQRDGWTGQTVQAGDKITVRMHPLRDGSHGGQLLSATLADGKMLRAGGPPPAAFGRVGP